MAPATAAAAIGDRVVIRGAMIVAFACAPGVAVADFANNEAIHAHVDAMVSRLDAATIDPRTRDGLFAGRVGLSLGALVPIYGSYELDHKVFGGVRPAAVMFDWILGGIAPAALGLTALADGSLTPHVRSILGWSALGLYTATRIGVLIIGNLHISEYNRYLELRLGVGEATAGQLVPALVASGHW